MASRVAAPPWAGLTTPGGSDWRCRSPCPPAARQPPEAGRAMRMDPVSSVTRCRDRRPEILDAIRREFHHSPRLALTLAQASRIWGLDTGTCCDLLDVLLDSGCLVRRHDGMYVRAAGTAEHSAV